jgi:hypothetical protein
VTVDGFWIDRLAAADVDFAAFVAVTGCIVSESSLGRSTFFDGTGGKQSLPIDQMSGTCASGEVDRGFDCYLRPNP